VGSNYGGKPWHTVKELMGPGKNSTVSNTGVKRMQWQSGEDLLEAVRGYQLACVLTAAADLDVFNALADGGQTASALAARIGGDARATAVLADALASAGVLEKNGDRYALPAALRAFLLDSSPTSVAAMIRHQGTCLRRWARLEWAVRQGGPEQLEPSVRGAAADYASFIEAMNVVSSSVAAWLVPEINPGDFRCVLDVGGGSGTWTLAWLKCHDTARAILFDLPEVIPLARLRLTGAGVADRVKLVGGDFEKDALPRGADLVWLSAIIHQNSREQNRELLQRIAAALEPGGSVYIRDILMDDSRTAPRQGAFFAVNMLVATPGGGTFTLREIREDLEQTGFRDVRLVRPDEGMHAVVTARKA